MHGPGALKAQSRFPYAGHAGEHTPPRMEIPMITIRPFAGLGHADHGWLNAHHHFSFADYHDPDRMGWGAIRVWNDDEIGASQGFPPHPHRDMEIITYVREGAITHQDSLGNRGRTEAGLRWMEPWRTRDSAHARR